MHEYSIVAALVERVEAETRSRAGARVRRVEIVIGEVAGVEIELLETAYETFKAGTICAEAQLEIRRAPAVWACPKCQTEVPRGSRLQCGKCNGPTRLRSGGEIMLQRIELEVDDV